MRAALAGIFVCVGLGITVNLMPETTPAWMIALVMVVTLIGLSIIALFIFDLKRLRDGNGQTPEQFVKDLEEKGLLASESFNAHRAFEVEETEDEGLHYFLELDNGSVVYLNGQYLYDYEEITDDPELNQPRLFPCTRFTVLRHKEEGYVIDINCEGEAFPPETTAPSFSHDDFKAGNIPEDGQVFTYKNYAQIKTERLKGRAAG